MRDWSDLEQLLPYLGLSSLQRRIALHLIEGRSTGYIALAMGVSERIVISRCAIIEAKCAFLRRRPPPDALAVVTTPKSPRPSPLKAARAVESRTDNSRTSTPTESQVPEPNKRLQDDRSRASLFRGA